MSSFYVIAVPLFQRNKGELMVKTINADVSLKFRSKREPVGWKEVDLRQLLWSNLISVQPFGTRQLTAPKQLEIMSLFLLIVSFVTCLGVGGRIGKSTRNRSVGRSAEAAIIEQQRFERRSSPSTAAFDHSLFIGETHRSPVTQA